MAKRRRPTVGSQTKSPFGRERQALRRGFPQLSLNFSPLLRSVRHGRRRPDLQDRDLVALALGDPEFVLHATSAKLYTAIVMRAAGSEVLPLRFAPYGEALREHATRSERSGWPVEKPVDGT